MARKETIKERSERLNRPVLIQIELSAATLAVLDELAPHFNCTRQEAIRSAVWEWTWRYRKKYTRRERLGIEATIREARDEVPLGPLLDRFRAQMEATTPHSVRQPVRVSHMDTIEPSPKQIAAMLDAEFYDRIAEIAKADERSIAYLIRKGLEKVAAEHDAEQPKESSIAAA